MTARQQEMRSPLSTLGTFTTQAGPTMTLEETSRYHCCIEYVETDWQTSDSTLLLVAETLKQRSALARLSKVFLQ